jgi:hypothetical protein
VIVDVTWPAAVAIDAAVWLVWSAAVGWRQSRRAVADLQPRGLERIRPWERNGHWYVQHVGIRRWKGWLPEAGTWFGGVSKGRRPPTEQGGWGRLAAECLRAERTHVGIAAATPVFVVWNPAGLFVANVMFAVIVNAPCYVVSRSARARAEAVDRRRHA